MSVLHSTYTLLDDRVRASGRGHFFVLKKLSMNSS